MTITLASHTKMVNSTAVALATSGSFSPSSGDLILVATNTDNLANATTDSHSGTWTLQGTAAVGNSDIAMYAHIATGTDAGGMTVTVNSSGTSGLVGIVMVLHSSVGAFTLANVYTFAKTTNTAGVGSGPCVYTGGSVTVSTSTDWVVGFVGEDNADAALAQDAPWTTLEVATSVQTAVVCGAEAHQTGVTGAQAPLWVVAAATTNTSSVVVAVSDVAGGAFLAPQEVRPNQSVKRASSW